MKMRNPIKMLFTTLLVVLCIPCLQGFLHVFKEEPLSGGIHEKPKPSFSLDGWWSGSYQQNAEAYWNDQFGFRSFFVRLHNQWDYWLFDKVHAQSVIRGKEGYLYEYNYIKAYYGLDFIGKDSIQNRMLRASRIRDLLKKKGKDLLLVFASSKGQFYPEFFPDSVQYQKGITNYEVYRELADVYKIPYVDFNVWMNQSKDSSRYPLYPKHGIHWTHYAACLVADSLIHTIEEMRQLDIPDLVWHKIHMAPPAYDDNDIERGLNLLAPLRSQWYAYPQYMFENDEGKVKPKVMVIADSYYWSLFNLGIFKSFGRNPFWFYLAEIYEPGGLPMKTYDEELLQKDMEDCDVIIVMATDANLPKYGWGFFERAENILTNPNFILPEYQEKIQNLIQYIPTDSAWIKHIRIKAKELKLPIDSVIRMDARWMVEQEMRK